MISLVSSATLHAQLVTLNMKNAAEKTILDTLPKKKVPARKRSGPFDGYDLHGYTYNQFGEPVPNVGLTYPQKYTIFSDARGFYHIQHIERNTKLTITGTTVETFYFVVEHLGRVDIPVTEKPNPRRQLTQGYTGYQHLVKKTTPSSSFVIDADGLQTKTSLSFAQRLEGIAPGLLLTTNGPPGVNQPNNFMFTGRTTLAANPNPLVVVDNFPYENNLALLNADDIEDITILKDASAAAIWGTRAANGVIVIRTKSSKYIPRLRVSFNTSISIGTKPDLFYADQLSSPDRIFIDSTLFKANYFNQLEKSKSRPVLSPVVEALFDKSLTDDDRRSLFATWRGQDNRYDQEKYFYRRSFSQHFSTQMATGNDWNSFYLSLGYDKSNPEINQSREERKTLLLNNRLYLLPGLEVTQSLSYSDNTQSNTDGVPEIPVPYGKLADANGHALPFPYLHRYSYIDTAGNGKLLDWKYYPLTEFNGRNRTITEKDVRFQAGITYNNFGKKLQGLEATLLFQHQHASRIATTIYDKNSFYVRDLINSYSQLTPLGISRPIPWGDIADQLTKRYNTFNFRFKLGYTKKWDYLGKLEVMAGRDIMRTRGDSLLNRLYNYSEKNGSGQNALDYRNPFPQFYFPSSQKKIPYLNKEKSEESYYYSTYVNGNFQYKGKYSLSASGRLDESNLFGNSTNGKIHPLLSAGFAWVISDERFYRAPNGPFLKLRASYGVSGNPTGNINAIQTISNNGYNANGDPIASFNNPALTRLRWDKVRTLNLGINCRTADDRLDASLDWYQKRATDLVSWQLLDPTSGNDFLINNAGAMTSRNVDFTLESKNICREVRWNSAFMVSYQKDRVITTGDTLQQAWAYCEPAYFTTVPGKPLYGVFSFPFKGLDTAGNPLGTNGTNYATMLTRNGYDSLHYHGRSTPAVFGNFTNNLYWKQFSLSVTVLYKLHYYFRRNSVEYVNIFNGTSKGSADFTDRWQKGKENHTDVPSMPVTATPDANRDAFYKYSSALIERGDHLRLQNIYLTYDLGRTTLRNLYLRTASFYVNCSNVGIIWRANTHQIDPDKLTGYPQPTIFTLGFKGTFK
jgi:TonB-linked SusC/RagA family outer membrane protein